MPKPAEYNFEFYEGDSESITLRLKDNAGNPLDLAGFTFYFQTARSTYHETGLNKQGTVTDNEVVFTFIAADFAELTLIKNEEQFIYDIQMENGASIRTLLKGNLIIHKGLIL